MTREEAIEEINKVFEPAFANYIITALTEGVTASDKALKQESKIKVLDRDEVIRKLGEVDVYMAIAWVKFFKNLDYLGMKICEAESEDKNDKRIS